MTDAQKSRPRPTCAMCDGTGRKDHAGFAMDPCDCVARSADKNEARMVWRDIKTDPPEMMTCVLLGHAYYSHGQIRHGYRRADGEWRGVNADGSDRTLSFRPTRWMPIPDFRAVAATSEGSAS